MIILASDHRGYELKKQLIEHFKSKNIDYFDVGTDSSESTDFPIFAKKGAEKLLESTNNIGVFICYSGNGMLMAANRFKGVRAALCTKKKWTQLARRDDLANVIVIPSGIVSLNKAKKLIDIFLSTPCGEGKYLRRANMIDDIEY